MEIIITEESANSEGHGKEELPEAERYELLPRSADGYGQLIEGS